MRRYVSGTDDTDQMLPVGNFLVCELVKEAGHMDGEPAVVNFQCPVAEDIEHLRIHHGTDEVKGRVGIRNHRKQDAFFIAQLFKLQFVIGHHFPDGGNIKGSQPCAAGNQNRL